MTMLHRVATAAACSVSPRCASERSRRSCSGRMGNSSIHQRKRESRASAHKKPPDGWLEKAGSSLGTPENQGWDIWSNNVLAKLSGRSLLVFSVIKDAADEAPEALSWLDPWLEHRGWTRSPDRFHAGHVSKRVRAGNKRALTTLQVLELWEETGVVSGAPLQKVALALEHSYSVVGAFTTDAAAAAPGRPGRPKLVGLARAISDGQFVALIADVAVLPSWQKRGIGRQLVRRLVLAVAERAKRGGDDGPDAFAVFPPPERREFFRACGFKPQPRFRWMRYAGSSSSSGGGTREPTDGLGPGGDDSGVGGAAKTVVGDADPCPPPPSLSLADVQHQQRASWGEAEG